jgi:hypothetical protein
MRVRTTIAGALGLAELVHDVDVRGYPPARPRRRQPDEIALELQFRSAVTLERKEDRFQGELELPDPRRQDE